MSSAWVAAVVLLVPREQPVRVFAVLPVYVINSAPINIVPDDGKLVASVNITEVATALIAPFNVVSFVIEL